MSQPRVSTHSAPAPRLGEREFGPGFCELAGSAGRDFRERDYMHTKEYYTGGVFKALNQFYHEPGHTFHHALLYL